MNPNIKRNRDSYQQLFVSAVFSLLSFFSAKTISYWYTMGPVFFYYSIAANVHSVQWIAPVRLWQPRSKQRFLSGFTARNTQVGTVAETDATHLRMVA